MALEGLAALSIASNVVQLVDFGSRLLSKSRSLYHSADGWVAADSDLNTIAGCLQRLSRSLIDRKQNDDVVSQNEFDFKSLATLCKGIADDLLAATERLQIKASHRKRQIFVVALKSIWTSDKIDEIRQRLHLASSQMTLSLLNLIKSVNLTT